MHYEKNYKYKDYSSPQSLSTEKNFVLSHMYVSDSKYSGTIYLPHRQMTYDILVCDHRHAHKNV